MLVAAGFLCKRERRSGFKLALVVGHHEDNHRVCFWRANSKRWTLPQTISADDLDHLTSKDMRKHARDVEDATRSAVESGLAKRVWL